MILGVVLRMQLPREVGVGRMLTSLKIFQKKKGTMEQIKMQKMELKMVMVSINSNKYFLLL